MNVQKLNPWNWFKHEEQQANTEVIPAKMADYPAHPMGGMLQLQREIDRLFNDAFRGFPALSSSLFKDDFLPTFQAKINVASTDRQYTVSLEAPGLEQKDVSVELKDGALLIKGNKQQEREEKEQQYYRVERRYGAFERVLAMPDDANASEISASMKNGVLSITIPRKEMPQSNARKINVSG